MCHLMSLCNTSITLKRRLTVMHFFTRWVRQWGSDSVLKYNAESNQVLFLNHISSRFDNSVIHLNICNYNQTVQCFCWIWDFLNEFVADLNKLTLRNLHSEPLGGNTLKKGNANVLVTDLNVAVEFGRLVQPRLLHATVTHYRPLRISVTTM